MFPWAAVKFQHADFIEGPIELDDGVLMNQETLFPDQIPGFYSW